MTSSGLPNVAIEKKNLPKIFCWFEIYLSPRFWTEVKFLDFDSMGTFKIDSWERKLVNLSISMERNATFRCYLAPNCPSVSRREKESAENIVSKDFFSSRVNTKIFLSLRRQVCVWGRGGGGGCVIDTLIIFEKVVWEWVPGVVIRAAGQFLIDRQTSALWRVLRQNFVQQSGMSTLWHWGVLPPAGLHDRSPLPECRSTSNFEGRR